MIRYEISLEELEKRVDSLSKSWRAAAKRKTEAFRKARRYEEKQGSWSAIKQAYIDLQRGKCAYCERKFSVDDKARIEHDIEHFRPKSSVKAWLGHYTFATGEGSERGYYLLAYHLLNYMASCKKCNSPYKSDYFPIAAERVFDTDDFAELAREQSLLIYPISDIDDDPEALITFEGLVPAPKAAQGHAYRRARVTIDFFGLAVREELLRERALIIKSIYVACEDLEHRDPLRRKDAEQTVHQISKPGLPHRNCARAFYDLYKREPSIARKYYEAAIDYLDSVGYGRI